MIKILLTVALLGSVGSYAIAQSKQGEPSGNDKSALLAKLEAQCAHRRIMPPDPNDDCAKLRQLRSEAQIGSGQDGVLASPGSGAGPGKGLGPGKGFGPGTGIGPGNGGGKGGGRR
jgi:hypothetical protein